MSTITIVDPVDVSSSFDHASGQPLAAKSSHGKPIDIDLDRIKKELKELQAMLNTINAEPSGGNYVLDEIEVSLAITTKGKLAIIGSGVEAGASAGLRAKFKRNDR